MALSETVHRRLLWAGVVAAILALRVGCVLYERTRPFPSQRTVQRAIEKDHLVAIPKFRVNDLQSARQLAGKTLWVRLGYATEYFQFQGSGQPIAKADARQFMPLESFLVKEVVERAAPGSPGKEVLLVFEKEGIRFAAPVGFYDSDSKSYQMQLDELFYLKDPHELYEHWGHDVWRKVEGHSLEPGMTVTQVALSLGFGRLVTAQAGGILLYEFTRKPGGEPGKTRVRFLDGRVKEFEVR